MKNKYPFSLWLILVAICVFLSFLAEIVIVTDMIHLGIRHGL